MRHSDALRWRRRMIATAAHDIHDAIFDFRRNYTDATFWLHALTAMNAETPDGNRDYLNAQCMVGGGDVWGFAFDGMGQRKHLTRDELLAMFNVKTPAQIYEDAAAVAYSDYFFRSSFVRAIDKKLGDLDVTDGAPFKTFRVNTINMGDVLAVLEYHGCKDAHYDVEKSAIVGTFKVRDQAHAQFIRDSIVPAGLSVQFTYDTGE